MSEPPSLSLFDVWGIHGIYLGKTWKHAMKLFEMGLEEPRLMWRSCVRWSRCKLSESKESRGFFFFVFQSLYPWNWSRTDGRWIPRSTNCFRQGSMYHDADTIILTHFSPAVPTTSGVQLIFIAPSRSIKSLNIFWSPQSLSPWTFAASLFSFLACINNVRALGADSSCVSVFKQ